tara:strand:- start:278 stop:661 length:384 start_codon:yes stop_codon:yes gene_type:complete
MNDNKLSQAPLALVVEGLKETLDNMLKANPDAYVPLDKMERFQCRITYKNMQNEEVSIIKGTDFVSVGSTKANDALSIRCFNAELGTTRSFYIRLNDKDGNPLINKKSSTTPQRGRRAVNSEGASDE